MLLCPIRETLTESDESRLPPSSGGNRVSPPLLECPTNRGTGQDGFRAVLQPPVPTQVPG